jgi:O-antigen/teichoic acid export membrane protein
VTTAPAVRPNRYSTGLRLTPFGSDGEFISSVHKGEVRRLAVLGVGATGVSQVFGIGVQIVSTVVLARLLTPADFGLVTMVTTFSLLLLNAGLNGLTEVVLQCDRIDRQLASNLFWVALATGAAGSVIFVGAAPLIAGFFADPRVLPVAVVLSLCIFLTSAQVLHRALLMRAMCFAEVYVIAAVARVASVIIAVALAWIGWGYWALVAGAVAQPIGESIGAWALCRWTPDPPKALNGTWAMVKFALHVYGRFSLNYFARNMDNVLVGWRFDAVVLGYYKKAYDLFALSTIFTSFSAVVVSALSRFRHDSSQFRRHVLSTISIAAFLGVGMGAILALTGRDVIRLILGAGWDPAGDVFVYFAPGVAATFVYSVHGWILLSSGRSDRLLKWGAVELVVTGAFFVAGLRWGAVGVAAASSAAVSVLVLPALWYAGRPIELGLGQVVRALWRYVIAGLGAAACTAMLAARVPPLVLAPDGLKIAARLATTSLAFASIYLLMVMVLYGGVSPLRQVMTLMMEVLPSRALPPPFSGAQDA